MPISREEYEEIIKRGRQVSRERLGLPERQQTLSPGATAPEATDFSMRRRVGVPISEDPGYLSGVGTALKSMALGAAALPANLAQAITPGIDVKELLDKIPTNLGIVDFIQETPEGALDIPEAALRLFGIPQVWEEARLETVGGDPKSLFRDPISLGETMGRFGLKYVGVSDVYKAFTDPSLTREQRGELATMGGVNLLLTLTGSRAARQWLKGKPAYSIPEEVKVRPERIHTRADAMGVLGESIDKFDQLQESLGKRAEAQTGKPLEIPARPEDFVPTELDNLKKVMASDPAREAIWKHADAKDIVLQIQKDPDFINLPANKQAGTLIKLRALTLENNPELVIEKGRKLGIELDPSKIDTPEWNTARKAARDELWTVAEAMESSATESGKFMKVFSDLQKSINTILESGKSEKAKLRAINRAVKEGAAAGEALPSELISKLLRSSAVSMVPTSLRNALVQSHMAQVYAAESAMRGLFAWGADNVRMFRNRILNKDIAGFNESKGIVFREAMQDTAAYLWTVPQMGKSLIHQGKNLVEYIRKNAVKTEDGGWRLSDHITLPQGLKKIDDMRTNILESIGQMPDMQRRLFGQSSGDILLKSTSGMLDMAKVTKNLVKDIVSGKRKADFGRAIDEALIAGVDTAAQFFTTLNRLVEVEQRAWLWGANMHGALKKANIKMSWSEMINGKEHTFHVNTGLNGSMDLPTILRLPKDAAIAKQLGVPVRPSIVDTSVIKSTDTALRATFGLGKFVQEEVKVFDKFTNRFVTKKKEPIIFGGSVMQSVLDLYSKHKWLPLVAPEFPRFMMNKYLFLLERHPAILFDAIASPEFYRKAFGQVDMPSFRELVQEHGIIPRKTINAALEEAGLETLPRRGSPIGKPLTEAQNGVIDGLIGKSKKALELKNKVKRLEIEAAGDQIAKGMTGLAHYMLAWEIRNSKLAGPKFNLVDTGTKDEEGNSLYVDTRVYDPFTSYLALADLVKAQLEGRNVSDVLDPSAVTDMLFGFRNLQNTGLAAIDVIQNLSGGHEIGDSLSLAIQRLAGSKLGMMSIFFKGLKDGSNAIFSGEDPTIPSIAADPLTGPFLANLPEEAQIMAMNFAKLQNDPEQGGLPPGHVPTRALPSKQEHARTRFFTGVTLQSMNAIERMADAVNMNQTDFLGGGLGDPVANDSLKKAMGSIIGRKVNEQDTIGDIISRAILTAETQVPEKYRTSDFRREILRKSLEPIRKAARGMVYLELAERGELGPMIPTLTKGQPSYIKDEIKEIIRKIQRKEK